MQLDRVGARSYQLVRSNCVDIRGTPVSDLSFPYCNLSPWIIHFLLPSFHAPARPSPPPFGSAYDGLPMIPLPDFYGSHSALTRGPVLLSALLQCLCQGLVFGQATKYAERFSRSDAPYMRSFVGIVVSLSLSRTRSDREVTKV